MHVLNSVAAFIKRFVSLSEAQSITVALWVAHTHALDAADTTPYLNITSAEKQCGKTRLLEVLGLLAAKPWPTGSVSKAVLVRKLDAEQPTLLLDESDAAFAGDKEYSEALRAVLNSGHSRDGVASLCVGQGTNIQYKDFHIFCPKAIAGIGKLPDTVADRSIPIRMKRRAPNEHVERFRPRFLRAEASEIRKQVADWITPNIPMLRSATPALPNLLSDRQQDGCEPLLAIAETAGADLSQSARTALLEILTGEAAEDNSTGVRLLSDIRDIFDQQRTETFSTFDLLAALCDEEPQWSEFSYGKPLSSATLARLLKRYGIHHRKLRLGERTLWGYQRASFEDAWMRYLPRKLEQVEQFSKDADNTTIAYLEQAASVPALESKESAINSRVVPDVPVRTECNGQQHPRHCSVHGTRTEWWERSSGDWICAKCHPSPLPTSKRAENLTIPTAGEIGFDNSLSPPRSIGR
jgi:hypothetical protein